MIKPFAWQLPYSSNVSHYFLHQPGVDDQVMAMCGLSVNTKDAVLATKIRRCQLCLDAIGENQ